MLISRGDFETRSGCDIGRGLWHYTHDPRADVLCFAYAIGDGPRQLWTPQRPAPTDLFEHLQAGGIFAAWNVMFEWHVWNYICAPKYGWPALRLEQCVDTMAQAAAMNLPQSLAGCGEALGLSADKAKAKRGKYLINKLCVPGRDGEFDGDLLTEQTLLQELYAYCLQDVVAEAAIAQMLRPLSEHEQQVWLATQRVNLRGLPIDAAEVAATVRVMEAERLRLDDEIKQVTKYAVTSATQREALLTWVNSRLATPLPDMTADTVQAALKREMPTEVRRALTIRQASSQTSAVKHETLLEIVCPDGTVKGLLSYHGASTGRWASRGGLNAQNLPRPALSDKDIATAHDVLGVGDHELARMLFGDQVMDAAVSMVRGVIKAPAGFEFIDADWSSVENRVGAWIAGQNDKLQMFAAGLDEYKVFASTALYGVPYDEVRKDQRQVSKSAVLGCMYGQGHKGLVEYAKGYGVDLTLERSKQIVDAYRNEYASVAQMWWDCADAILEAVREPDTTVTVRNLHLRVARGFLWLRLPSGRVISWQAPKEETLDTPWGDKRQGVTVMGVDRFTRKWTRTKLIGSSVYQSAVQGTARDLMADALLRLETAGYSVVLLVHDEFLCIVPNEKGSEEELIQIMCQAPSWAKGLPLAAEAWRGTRYRK